LSCVDPRGFIVAALFAAGSFALAGATPAFASPPTAAAAAASTPAPELPVLPEVDAIGGVARMSLAAAIDPATKLPSFYYGGSTTAPTIRVHPGDAIVIEYTNDLPYETQMPLDFTNLHFHGLTVSPKAPGDQVIMTTIAPGQTYRYVVKIPPEQAPGLYWYHPHPHGESNRQVAAGMSGLIVIDGVSLYAPQVRGLAERDIILRDYYYDAGEAPFARSGRRGLMHAAAQLRKANPALSVRDAIHTAASSTVAKPNDSEPDCDPDDEDAGHTINGLPKATISMVPGSHQFFRIANTSANTFFDVSLKGSQLFVVGTDGVPLGFHNRATSGYLTNHYMLPPAGRVEFVNASPLAPGSELHTACVDTGPAGDVNAAHDLADIALRPVPAAVPLTDSGGRLPNAAPAPPAVDRRLIAAQHTLYFTENNPLSEFYINGKLWNPAAPPMYVAHTGTLEEWTIRNLAYELHAFHIHQIHFLVESVNGVPQPPNTWRDTILLPYAHVVNGVRQPGEVKLLMDFRDPVIAGTFVFHCHILEHEDYGMMAKIQVIGPANATAQNPFAAFVKASVAFAAAVSSKLTGRTDALAVIGHMCGFNRSPEFVTDPMAEGFIRPSAGNRPAARAVKHAILSFTDEREGA